MLWKGSVVALALVGGGLSALAAEGTHFGAWGTLVDPLNDSKVSISANGLTVALPAGDHDLGAERGQMSAPRVLQAVDGDFIVQVRVSARSRPTDPVTVARAPFHGAGLLLMQDEKNYIRLEQAAFSRDGNSYCYVSFELRKEGKTERFALPSDLPLNAKADTVLRLERHGDLVRAAATQYSEVQDWAPESPLTQAFDWHWLPPTIAKFPRRVHVGIAAVNVSNEEFAPRFGEFKLFIERGETERRTDPEGAFSSSAPGILWKTSPPRPVTLPSPVDAPAPFAPPKAP